ncbi:hypothetical protein [uncultured Chloroflexus sp.]|uniref:hypothetical protein n=1 Tax=uncultured Chloroflexus sp. TaxID=214040 RepID=UPI00260E1E3B|nr:hypothetical protein [uncultured Chloroflexus sp.]
MVRTLAGLHTGPFGNQAEKKWNYRLITTRAVHHTIQTFCQGSSNGGWLRYPAAGTEVN